jgi:hypothetical protein
MLGMRFTDVAGLDQDTRRRIYHQALLRYIGCNADTHLLSAHWGDEITLRRELHHIDIGNRAEFVELLVRAPKRKFAGATPEELEEAVVTPLSHLLVFTRFLSEQGVHVLTMRLTPANARP